MHWFFSTIKRLHCGVRYLLSSGTKLRHRSWHEIFPNNRSAWYEVTVARIDRATKFLNSWDFGTVFADFDFFKASLSCTSMSLREFPLLKHISGASLKICREEGRFVSRAMHFSNKTCFGFGTIWRYCVTFWAFNFSVFAWVLIPFLWI